MVCVISNAFPSLQRLRISAVSEDIPPRTPTPRLAFDALEPLLRLGFLDLLRVCYTTPLHLTNDDLSRICWTLESITSLHLNPTPPIRTTSSLHLSCLAEAHFTYSLLERLGIYVNTSLEGFRGLRIAKDLPLFAHLTDLNFGYSSLRHEAVGPVVEFLSEILPDGCKIDAEDPHSELKYGLGDLPPQWQQVSSIVPALRQAPKAVALLFISYYFTSRGATMIKGSFRGWKYSFSLPGRSVLVLRWNQSMNAALSTRRTTGTFLGFMGLVGRRRGEAKEDIGEDDAEEGDEAADYAGGWKRKEGDIDIFPMTTTAKMACTSVIPTALVIMRPHHEDYSAFHINASRSLPLRVLLNSRLCGAVPISLAFDKYDNAWTSARA
ncbi:hypothetical protein ONZ45_g14789 [Pleurotus djamor]|nr:hypothetical protein ONZ45_g14789 [Pleurotus djamor]